MTGWKPSESRFLDWMFFFACHHFDFVSKVGHKKLRIFNNHQLLRVYARRFSTLGGDHSLGSTTSIELTLLDPMIQVLFSLILDDQSACNMSWLLYNKISNPGFVDFSRMLHNISSNDQLGIMKKYQVEGVYPSSHTHGSLIAVISCGRKRKQYDFIPSSKRTYLHPAGMFEDVFFENLFLKLC